MRVGSCVDASLDILTTDAAAIGEEGVCIGRETSNCSWSMRSFKHWHGNVGGDGSWGGQDYEICRVEGAEDFQGDIGNGRERRLMRDGKCIYVMFRMVLYWKRNCISFSLSLVVLEGTYKDADVANLDRLAEPLRDSM
jgi:hypothetical protein